MTVQEMTNRLKVAYPDGNVEAFSNDNVHFEVLIESKVFKGLTRIEQHQHVMNVFKHELHTGDVHALSIKTKIL